MAVGAGLIQFPFAGGIVEGTRDEVVEAGQGWATLENVRQDKRGALSKRHGFAALTSTLFDASSPTTGYKLVADRDTAVRIADGFAQVYDAKATRWRKLGRVPNCATRIVDIPTPGKAGSFASDVEYANGYFAVCWLTDPGTTHETIVAVFNASTFATVRVPEVVGSSNVVSCPQIVAVGNKFVLLRHTTGNTINAWYLDTSSAATIETGWVAFGAAIATDASAVAISVCSLPGATPKAAVAYVNTSGGASQLTVKTFDGLAVLQTQTVNTTSVTPSAVSIAGQQTDTLWVAWNENLNARVRGLNPTDITLTALATTATIFSTVSDSPSVLGIAYGQTAGTARLCGNDAATRTLYMNAITTSGGAATPGTAVTVVSAQVASKPAQYGGRYYVPAFGSDEDCLQNTVVLVDWTENEAWLRPVANPAPSLCVPGLVGQGKFIPGPDANVYYFPIGIKRSGISDGAALVEVDFTHAAKWSPAACGNSLYLSGGVVSYSDGARIAEASFLFRPPKPTTSVSGTGITGTFRYVAVYEEVDADGNIHISDVSDPSEPVSPANQTVQVQTYPLAITARRQGTTTASALRVAIYRTKTGGEAPYYRLATVTNDPTGVITYSDATSDTVLGANAKLYTQPGVIGTAQSRRAPPGLTHLVAYNGFLCGAVGSDVWFSGQQVVGEGLWWNPIFQVPVPGDGDVTALAVMDGALFVFKRRDIYAISGEPPSDNGMQGGLGAPRRLGVDIGASSHHTCVTSLGCFFQSDRGIELLNRGQAVEWVGEPVQETLASYPAVFAMTVDPASSCVLIDCASGEADAVPGGLGRTLVFDLALKQWVSVDRRTGAGGADAPAVSAAMIYTSSGYRYAWMDSSATVYVEDRATYLDPSSTWVAMRAVSPWIKAGGLQGHQHVNRLLVLAKRGTHHDVTVSLAYDYSASYANTRLYTATQINTLVSALPNQQMEHPLGNDARCEALRVKLEDATPSTGQSVTTGQGATWIALAFEVAPQQGAYRLPDEAR